MSEESTISSDLPSSNTANVDNPEGFLDGKKKLIKRKKSSDYVSLKEWLENRIYKSEEDQK